MKLRLPNKLIAAIMASFATAYGFDGPSGVSYTGSIGITDANRADIEVTENSVLTGSGLDQDDKPVIVNAEGYNVKMTGAGTGTQYGILSATADSLWLSQGRFRVAAPSALTNAGDLYVGGGQMWLAGSSDYTGNNKITNNVILGTSTWTGDADNKLKYAAMRVSRQSDISGVVTVQENSKITFEGNGSNMTISGALVGTGDLDYCYYNGNNHTVTLSGDTSGYHGTLSLTGAITLNMHANAGNRVANSPEQYLHSVILNNSSALRDSAAGESMRRHIGTLAVNGTASLTQESWNTLWTIDHLNNGTSADARMLKWEMSTNHYSNSILYLTGEGNFDGTLQVNRNKNSAQATNGAYQAYVDIAHSDALKNAVLDMNGSTAYSYVSLALNTKDVNMAGLKGTQYGIVYAGEAVSGVGTGSNTKGSNAPTSTSFSTLHLNVSGDNSYTYQGSVLGGVSIVKDGNGTQTFSGDMSAFNGNIVVNEGTLAVTNGLSLDSTARVNGGNLTLGGIVTLDAENPLKYALYTGSGEGVESPTYSNEANGFLREGTQYRYIARTSGTGTVTMNDDFSLHLGDAEGSYTAVSDGYVFAASAAAGSIYYVNTDLAWTNVGSTEGVTAYSVADDKTFSASGNNLAGKGLILNQGATFATTADLRFNAIQLTDLTLEGDATIDASNGILGVIGSGFAGGVVNLNGHTLSIIGSGKGLSLAESTVNAGTISVGSGSYLQLMYDFAYNKTVSAENTVLELADNAALRVGGTSNTIKLKGINNTGTGAAIITSGTDQNGAEPTAENVNGGTLELTAHEGEVYNYKGTLAGKGTGTLALKMSGAGTQNMELTSTAQLSSLTMTAGKLNFSGDLVSVVGSRVDIGYSRGSAEAVFAEGLEVTGAPSNGYALVVGGSSKVTLGGTSRIDGYNIGVQSNGELILDSGAQVTANHFYNSSSSNGKLTVRENAAITFTNNRAQNNADNSFQELTNAGSVTFSGARNTTINALTMSGGSLTKSGSGNVTATLKSGQTTLGGKLVNDNTGLLKLTINNSVVLTGGYDLGTNVSSDGADYSGRLEFNVAQNAVATISGPAAGSAFLDKSGAGELVINRGSVANALYRANGGMLTLKSADSEEAPTQLGGIYLNGGDVSLDGGSFSIGGSANTQGLFVGGNGGCLSLTNGAGVTVNMHTNAGQDWKFQIAVGETKGVRVENGSAFKVNTNHGETLSVKALGAADATITATNAQVNYNIANANAVISNAEVSLSKDSAATLVNTLTNSAITNDGSGILTVSNDANTLVGVDAELGAILVQNAANSAATLKSIKAVGGDVTIQSLDAGATVNLTELTIAGSKTVSAYTGTPTAEQIAAAQNGSNTAVEATLAISNGTLTAGSGAKLNAHLSLGNNTTLNIADATVGGAGLTMGSSVTIAQNAKINLSNDIINGLNSLTIGEGLTLFSGVDAFTINNEAYDADTIYHASDFFKLDNGNVAVTRPWDFVVKFDTDAAQRQSGDGGSIYLYKEMPEPATATLSLLALAALAARRKRK